MFMIIGVTYGWTLWGSEMSSQKISFYIDVVYGTFISSLHSFLFSFFLVFYSLLWHIDFYHLVFEDEALNVGWKSMLVSFKVESVSIYQKIVENPDC